MKYVVFDFNGTVVDDLELSLKAINATAKKFLNRSEITKEEYRNVFTFPVKNYYEALGFDFNKLDWASVGRYWMDYYLKHRKEAKIHEGIVDLLKDNHLKGYKNVLLSASEINLLTEQVKELGIFEYFDEIHGIDNIYASSKLPIALNFMKDKDPKDVVYLGDSLHDYDVASEMKVRCILIANGHQSKERLLKKCKEVYDNINEVKI